MRAIVISAAVGAVGVAVLLGAAAGGVRGGTWTGVAVVAVGAVIVGATRFREPSAARRPVPPRKRPASPAGATTARQRSAIFAATRDPRSADVELRPILTRVVASIRESSGRRSEPTTTGQVLGEELARFIDPDRAVRGYDDGDAPTTAVIAKMLAQLEDMR